MNNQLKSLSITLLALGLSMPAFAEGSVCVPSQKGGFKIGIDALYARPTNSDLDYAPALVFLQGVQADLKNAFVDTSYNWGFYAQVGYLFPCTGNDLTLGYTHLHSNDNDSFAVALPAGFDGFIELVPWSTFFGIVAFDAARGTSEINLDVGDLEAGQRFTTGAYDLRMFAGLRYGQIDYTLNSTASVTVGPNTTVGFQQFASNFKGLGPRIGVDARYCLQSGFGLDADLSTSLLIGNLDARYLAIELGNNVVVASRNVHNGSRNRVVPVLEAKLGADYTYIVDRCNKSSLVFEAGYQVTNYFNVVDHARAVVGDTIASQNTTSDVGFDGIYVGVKYYA